MIGSTEGEKHDCLSSSAADVRPGAVHQKQIFCWNSTASVLNTYTVVYTQRTMLARCSFPFCSLKRHTSNSLPTESKIASAVSSPSEFFHVFRNKSTEWFSVFIAIGKMWNWVEILWSRRFCCSCSPDPDWIAYTFIKTNCAAYRY